MDKKGSLYFFSITIFLFLMIVGTFLSLKHSQEISAEDFKCLKCHKGKDSLEKYVKERNIKTGEELRNLLKKGPKAGLHLTSTEEDLEKAIKYLNLP